MVPVLMPLCVFRLVQKQSGSLPNNNYNNKNISHFLVAFYVPGYTESFIHIISLICHKTQRGKYYFLHFTDKESHGCRILRTLRRVRLQVV